MSKKESSVNLKKIIKTAMDENGGKIEVSEAMELIRPHYEYDAKKLIEAALANRARQIIYSLRDPKGIRDVFANDQLGAVLAHVLDKHFVKFSTLAVKTRLGARRGKILAGETACQNLGGRYFRDRNFLQVGLDGVIAEVQFVARHRVREKIIRREDVEGQRRIRFPQHTETARET